MAEITSLREAVAALVHDGDTVALEGFTHLIPYAAGHEIVRQGRTGLTLVRMTPDVIYDQMIGMGVANKLIFSWAGNPGVGSLHRFRDAMQRGWPAPLEIEEHSHAGMAARYTAAAAALPFGVLHGYAGTDLPAHTDTIAPLASPFTGEQVTAVKALDLDVAVIHAQQVDHAGNVGLWGITGVQKEAVLAAKRSIVTVEERVERLDPRVTVVLPSWVVSAVAIVPQGTHPSYALGYSERDNAFYTAWDAVSRDRDTFVAWMRRHVMDTADFTDYLRSLDRESLTPRTTARAASRRAAPVPAPAVSAPAAGGATAPAVQATAPAATLTAEAASPVATLKAEAPAPATSPATAEDIMTVVAARQLSDGAVCFVGIGLPSLAANLARRTFAPNLVLVYESGTIGAKPTVPPLSIGDGELAETADAVVSVPEIFAYWLQSGRIDVGFLGAAQLDRFGNINTTVIGAYDSPQVRLPGAGGAPEIASNSREVVVVLRHNKRNFVDSLDFISSVGHLDGGDSRQRLGLRGRGPTAVITDLGVLRPDPVTNELALTAVHPGVDPATVIAATGWPLRVAEKLVVTEPPTDEELRTLRELRNSGS